MAEEVVLYHAENGKATLTINRPERRNALSPEVLTELIHRLNEIENDPDVRVVIITGTGDKVFSSGADLGKAMSGGGGAVPVLPPGWRNKGT